MTRGVEKKTVYFLFSVRRAETSRFLLLLLTKKTKLLVRSRREIQVYRNTGKKKTINNTCTFVQLSEILNSEITKLNFKKSVGVDGDRCGRKEHYCITILRLKSVTETIAFNTTILTVA